jgi:hypothetical protein
MNNKKLWPYYVGTFFPFLLWWIVYSSLTVACHGPWDYDWLISGFLSLSLFALLALLYFKMIKKLSKKRFLLLYTTSLIIGIALYPFIMQSIVYKILGCVS